MTPLKGLPPAMLLHLLAQVFILLGLAHVLGEAMRRWKQPAVIGQILAGVLLGPSALGHWFPALQLTIFPHDQNQANLLAGISWLGLLLLLLMTGLETDLDLVIRKGRTAFLISAGGLILPLASGFVLGRCLPDSMLAHPDQRLVFSLFLAVAMCITSLPVIATIMTDLKLIRRDIGQVTLAAAMLDDTLGWILLSVVSGLALSGHADLPLAGQTLGIAVLFLLLSFAVGRPLVRRVLTWADDQAPGSSAQLSLLLFLAFLASTFTLWAGLEAVLGAFVMGILAASVPRLRGDTVHALGLITTSFLAPLYFGLAGLRIDIWGLLHWDVFLIMLAVIAVACFGKLVGVYLGAWAGGLSHWERLALGSGMNARGAVEIIVATVGLSMGVLNYPMYSIIVLMAVATSMMAGPMLKWSLAHVTMGAEEADRLDRDASKTKSLVRSLQRVLLPTRGGANIKMGAHLISLLNKSRPLEATAFFVTHGNESGDFALESVNRCFLEIGGSGCEMQTVSGKKAAPAILAEAEKAYDLIVLGASAGNPAGPVDDVMRSAPCPTLVVRSRSASLASIEIRKILVYTEGTHASSQAVEMAAALAAGSGAQLTILCLAQLQENQALEGRGREAGLRFSQEIAAAETDLARKLGAAADALVLEATRPEAAILQAARDGKCDLIVLSSSVRRITKRLFLGSLVENILRNAPCAVAVLSHPSA